jgi:hypothetical protein
VLRVAAIPSGFKNALIEKLPVCLAARFFNDDAQQVISGVVVSPGLARLEFQRQFEKHPEQFIAGRRRFRRNARLENVHVPGDRHVVLDARCVSEKMPNSDAVPRLGRVGKILRDFVLESDLALLDQHHDRCGGELLGIRPDFINGRVRGRDVELKVGDAVTLGFDDFAIANNRDRDARDTPCSHLRADVIIHCVGLHRSRDAESQQTSGAISPSHPPARSRRRLSAALR